MLTISELPVIICIIKKQQHYQQQTNIYTNHLRPIGSQPHSDFEAITIYGNLQTRAFYLTYNYRCVSGTGIWNSRFSRGNPNSFPMHPLIRRREWEGMRLYSCGKIPALHISSVLLVSHNTKFVLCRL